MHVFMTHAINSGTRRGYNDKNKNKKKIGKMESFGKKEAVSLEYFGHNTLLNKLIP